jgi:uncharacterized membrane protein SpoIIM required for sporulation
MKAERFVSAHRAGWKRLSDLVDRAQHKRLNALTNEELHELGALYRRASSDLARAQTRYSTTVAGRELVRSLNDLVLRAHTVVYSAPPPTPVVAFSFVLYGFPAAFRRQWRAIVLAALFMFLPSFIAYGATRVNPKLAEMFVPASAIEEVQKRADKKIITGWGGNTEFEGVVSSPGISSYIMVNNIKVSLRAAAFGVTMGIGTALVLIMNGMMIGGLSGAASNADVDLLFWAVILPHGILELTAICIAGGAGLVLARALYAPGDMPRRDAIRLAGGEAMQLLIGVAVMLVVAGLIEGFITPLPIPPLLKISFALLTGIGMVLYLNIRPRATTDIA